MRVKTDWLMWEETKKREGLLLNYLSCDEQHAKPVRGHATHDSKQCRMVHAHGKNLILCARYVIGRVNKVSIKVQTDTRETCLERRMDARSRWGVSDRVGAQPSWPNGLCWR
uniref:Uncharacterized protein n=1 Tax=Photinus pyralis TaxID=7054 RepID=A0A1Y1MMG2_PHOPY